MRIAYINHGRFPTEKAHGFQIAQVCEATAALGHEVTLICPTLKNAVTADPRSYYGLRHPITVEYAGQYDAFQSPVIPGALAFITTLQFYKRALRRRVTPGRFDLLYTRSPFLLATLLKTDVPVILELHTLPRFFRRRFAASCNRCKKVVCLTGPMRQELVSWGVHAGKVIVEGDGVDLRRFEKLPDPSSAKVRWNLPADRPVIGYVGSLVTRETLEKGVRELIGASEKLKVKSGFCGLLGDRRNGSISIGPTHHLLNCPQIRFDSRATLILQTFPRLSPRATSASTQRQKPIIRILCEIHRR